MWVATMDTPAPGCQFWGIVNARTALWLLRCAYVYSTPDPLTEEVRRYEPGEVVLAGRLQALLPVILLPDLSRLSDTSGRSSPSPPPCTFWKPAFSRRADAACTAWKGVGEALRKSTSLWAASGPGCYNVVMVRKGRAKPLRATLSIWSSAMGTKEQRGPGMCRARARRYTLRLGGADGLSDRRWMESARGNCPDVTRQCPRSDVLDRRHPLDAFWQRSSELCAETASTSTSRLSLAANRSSLPNRPFCPREQVLIPRTTKTRPTPVH